MPNGVYHSRIMPNGAYHSRGNACAKHKFPAPGQEICLVLDPRVNYLINTHSCSQLDHMIRPRERRSCQGSIRQQSAPWRRLRQQIRFGPRSLLTFLGNLCGLRSHSAFRDRGRARSTASPPLILTRLDVWSRVLMVHSCRGIRRMRYGTDSTRQRHDDRGDPSSDTA